MTSTTDTTRHPDVSEISDLTEGLLAPSRTAGIRAHVDGCELCSDVRASLEEIRGLLGTLPGPTRMPADIAGRIDAALAAEALLDATAPSDPEEAGTGAQGSRATGDVSRETSPTPTAATAARAERRPRSGDRPVGRSSSATGPGRSPHPARRRRTAVLGALFGVAAVSLSVFVLQAIQPSDNGPTAQADRSAASAQQQTFAGAPVGDQVKSLLSTSGESKRENVPESSKAPRSAEAPSTFRTEDVAVPPCVQEGTGRTEAALAAERGNYGGTPAYLVVLPHAQDPAQVQAYVMDASCTARPEGGAKADVLLTHAYPRP
ncbi:hypothetical protein [Streptomyces sp. NPDC046887]|uniref:hypothetical protein n=1 Tax=Streptomyces sp. NPDC046887 TaxID=3155472 RepID=UPI0033C1E8E7